MSAIACRSCSLQIPVARGDAAAPLSPARTGGRYVPVRAAAGPVTIAKRALVECDIEGDGVTGANAEGDGVTGANVEGTV